METRPAKRICPSAMLARRKKASRQLAGARKGSRPSRINIKPKATASEAPMRSVAHGSVRVLQELEEVRARIDDQDIALAPETVLIRIKTAIERSEERRVGKE